MRLLNLITLVPLALAAPTRPSIPELSLNEWSSIQTGFFDGVASVAKWTLGKTEQLLKDDKSDLTIWQALKADPNSFSKLVKIIEFEGKAIEYLDDKDLQITFFAPNNDALTPPHHHHHDHDDDDDDDDFAELAANPSLAAVSAMLDADPSLHSSSKSHDGDDDDDDDDDKKKRRRAIFKKIVGKVLQYHGLLKAYTGQELAENVTIATALKADDGSFGGLFRRLRIDKTLLPPAIKLNFFAKILVADIKCRNGYLHTLDLPLIPPPSIFEETYLFPDVFSTLTSAVQHLHARKYLDWHYDPEASEPGKPKFRGNPLTTLFAPTNVAFGLIPPKLKFYLFSPFGEHVLAKLLMYHAIPDTLLLSEFMYTEKKKDSWGFSDMVEAYEHFNIADDPTFHKELTVETALENATLKIEIDKTKVLPIEGATKTSIKVNGGIVRTIDVPAQNGALHVIDFVLVPPHKHHGHDHDGDELASASSWDHWEEWLPAWAEQA